MDADALRLSDTELRSITGETRALIECALQNVREAAKLDDDPVLPPLPSAAPRRNVVVFRASELPLPPAPPASAPALAPSPALPGASAARASAKARARTVVIRPVVKAASSRWALLLCGVVAGAATAAAVLASPLGLRPAAAHARGASLRGPSAAAHARGASLRGPSAAAPRALVDAPGAAALR